MIESHEISALMRSVSKAIDERVADRTRNLEAENVALRKMVDDLIRRVDSLPKEGIVGPMGPQGERGLQGPAGESIVGPQGLQGEKGLQGAPGERGVDGAIGPKGDTGERGPQGEKGADGIGIIGPQGPVGPAGEKGERGERGEKGLDGTQGPQGVIGIQGEPGQRGEVGARGEKGERGDAGQMGPQGLQGERGEPGRDAAEIHPLPEIEPGKKYARGVWVRHKGGLVRSDGAGGWDVMQNGIAVAYAKQSDADPRNIVLVIEQTDGKSENYPFHIPAMLYRGIFKAGTYEQGDTVTWDGSLWHCNAKSTDGAPGKSSDWQLCVKRGNHGKDATAQVK